MGAFLWPGVPSGAYYMAAAYVIAGLTTAVNIYNNEYKPFKSVIINININAVTIIIP